MVALAIDRDRDLEMVLGEITRITARPRQAASDPWIGRTIADRYRVVQHLADGGMGHVYIGEQVSLGMSVAIKVLDACAYADPMLAGRFEREATATATLRNPHIVQVFDWGNLPEGGYYMVMELLPGTDLATLLMSDGLLGPRRTLHVLRQLAIAVDHAHAHGIVHRDLKPENVMIDVESGDFAKVLDFGVARDLSASGTYTNYGEVVGTPEYMAPEQALGRQDKIGPATDLYALGAMALEMLTGDLPYPSAPAMTMLQMIVDAPPRRPSELGLDIAGLDAVFDRAMARRPSERYPSARAFVDALEAALVPSWADGDPSSISGVRPRLDSRGATMPAMRAEGAEVLAMRPALADAAAAAQMPGEDASVIRIASAVVVAGMTVVGSAFVAGWLACLVLAG